MPQMIRKKVKWATKRRKGGTRVWKTKWILVAQGAGKPAPRGTGPSAGAGGGASAGHSSAAESKKSATEKKPSEKKAG